MSRDGGFSSGLLFGALIGAGIALLTSTRTGKENREWLAKQLQENEDIQDWINKGKHSSEDLIAHTRKSIQDNLDHLSDLVDGGKQKLKKVNDKKETFKGPSEN